MHTFASQRTEHAHARSHVSAVVYSRTEFVGFDIPVQLPNLYSLARLFVRHCIVSQCSLQGGVSTQGSPQEEFKVCREGIV